MRAMLIGWAAAAASLAAFSMQPASAYERPWLGTYIADAPAPKIGADGARWHGGARVFKVEGPADAAGVLALDVIVELDGEPIAGATDLTCRIAARTPGASVTLTIVRGGQRMLVTATLGRWPVPDQVARPPPGCVSDMLSGAWAERPA